MVATLLAVQIGTTLFMMGLVWFVQVVHYPLLARVGLAEFTGYEAAHRRRTMAVTLPVMTAEAATAVALAWDPPAFVGPAWCWLNLELLIILWLSTLFVQMPLHRRLTTAFDAAALRRLVLTNWLRTAVWTVRAVTWLVLVTLQAAK